MGIHPSHGQSNHVLRKLLNFLHQLEIEIGRYGCKCSGEMKLLVVFLDFYNEIRGIY